MKTLMQCMVPALTALLGYGAALTSRPVEEKPRAASAPARAPAEAPAPFTQPNKADVDPIANVIVALGGAATLADLASVAAALEKLSPQQLGALLDRIMTLPARADFSEGDRQNRVKLLMGAWTLRDPEAATAWMRPKVDQSARIPGFGSGYTSAEVELVRTWAYHAPKLALEVARRNPRANVTSDILSLVMFSMRDVSHATRFETLRDFPAGPARERAMRSLVESWSREEMPAALTAIGSMEPSEERTKALRNTLAIYAGRDVQAGLARAEEFGVVGDPATVQRLTMMAGRKAPYVTARWLEALGPALLQSAGPGFVLAWAEKEPVAALKWALTHGIDITTRVSVGTARTATVVQTLSVMREPQEMLPLLALLPAESASQGVETIAAKFGGLRFEEARRWAESLPAGPARTAAWTSLGKNRGNVEPQMPRGPDRDALLRGMTQINIYSESSPERPMKHALGIDDPRLRRQTFDELMERWVGSTKYRETAVPWLGGAAVPEDWKVPWHKRLK